ncbi:protein unc-93 homolog A-like [Rhopilema esculentum]|uniref:protein unc-93 homolog A-like n=1 Tax=Rhopilema esculentum TaxID=499914 RepID=UPI0031CFAB04
MEIGDTDTKVENAPLAGPIGETTNHISSKKKVYLIWKNVLLVSLSFSVTFMSFASLQNLQSSLNPVGGLGVASLSVSYSLAILTGIFASSMIVKKKGCKWSLMVFTFCYAPFAAANLYPTWYTMIPASVIIGIAAGPVWTAKATYITSSALQYVDITGAEKGPAITKFFGVFQMILTSGNIIGSLLISIVLKPDGSDATIGNITNAEEYTCGAADCPSKNQWSSAANGTAAVKVANLESVNILMGIFLGAVVLAGLILVPIDDVNSSSKEKRQNQSVKSHIFAVANIVYRDKRMACLLPFCIYAGLSPGFIAVDLAKSYVTCAFGIENLGFVFTVLLCTQTVSAGLIGKFEQYIGRRSIIVSNSVLSMGLLVFLLKWRASSSPAYVFYLVAACYGVTKSVWRTESNSVCGLFFADKQEPAFAVLRVCVSFGFVLSFASGYYLCVYMKIYFHMFIVTLALIGYGMAEYFDRKMLRKENIKERLGLQMKEIS